MFFFHALYIFVLAAIVSGQQPVVLQPGYPTKLTITEEKVPCVTQFEVPTGVSRVYVFSNTANINPLIEWRIYAKKGAFSTIPRDASLRINPDSKKILGLIGTPKWDHYGIIDKPEPGTYSVGVYADCQAGLLKCNGIGGDTVNTQFSVVFEDALGQPHVPLYADVRTADVDIKGDLYAYFTFTLDQAKQFFVDVQRDETSPTDKMQFLIVKGRVMPTVESATADQKWELQNDFLLNLGTGFSGGKELVAGDWTFIVYCQGSFVDGGCRFNVRGNFGVKPSDTDNYPTYTCPATADALTEVGVFDECAVYGNDCQGCMDQADTCIFCYSKVLQGSCQKKDANGGKCNWGTVTDPVTTCPKACGDLDCTACIAESDCSYCAISVFGKSFGGCETGTSCLAHLSVGQGLGVDPATDAASCTAIDNGDVVPKTAPPTNAPSPLTQPNGETYSSDVEQSILDYLAGNKDPAIISGAPAIRPIHLSSLQSVLPFIIAAILMVPLF